MSYLILRTIKTQRQINWANKIDTKIKESETNHENLINPHDLPQD